MRIGDLDCLRHETVGDPASRFEVLSYNVGGVEGRNLMNYFLACGRNNPLFERSHRLLLELWAADGGKTSTEGMHSTEQSIVEGRSADMGLVYDRGGRGDDWPGRG